MSDIPFRGIVLQQASQATLKTRHEVYGDPFIDMQCAAQLTALYREHAGDKYHPAHDEAMARVFIKIARIACGIPGHTDSYVDAAAYMAIAAECQMTADIAEIAAQNRQAAVSQGYIAPGSIVVEDPINRDTALPKEPTRGINADLAAAETHAEVKRVDPTPSPSSPFKEFMFKHAVVHLGDWVRFNKDADKWMVTAIYADGALPTFTVQHETSGRVETHIGAHIFEVVR